MTDETETPQPDEAADSSMEDDWAAAMAEQAVAEAAAAQPAQIFQSFDQGGSKAASMMKLMEALDNDDDVQNVFANFEIADDIMAKLSA